jgi:predicted KAP-like P-loop ATPase
VISPDAPITRVQDDKLGRAPFARALAKTLLANTAEESFVVGVHGKWGTGKSSVLNLCVEELKAQSKDTDQVVDILRFNPWNFADQNQLVLQFFRQFTGHLQKLDKKTVGQLKNLIESLDAYATTLGPPIEAIPYGRTILTGLRAGVGVARRSLGMGQDLDSLYNSISGQLQQLKRKTVVVIDDIDRLTASEIRQIFQLVKISARFPYVIYLVAFDRTAVTAALEGLGVGSGEEYLEKIVQVSFDLPPISEAMLTTMILESIGQLVEQYPAAKFDTHRFGNVFHAGIRDSFESLRDVQRFLNGLEFGFGMVSKEVNGVDFIGLECLRIFYPTIFEAVRSNKKIFSGHIDPIQQEKGAAEYRKSVENAIPDKDSLEKTKDLLIELFPKLSWAYANTLYGGESEEHWERDLRIATARYFDLYFQLVVSSDDVSTSEVDKLCESVSDSSTLTELLNNYIYSKKIVNALSAFRHSFDNIKSEALPNILQSLFDIGDRVDQRGPFSGDIPDLWHVRWAIFDVLERIPADARVNTVADTFKASSGIATMIDFILVVEEELKRRADKYAGFTDEVRAQLKALVLERIPTIASDKLLANQSLPSILFYWKSWGNGQGPASFVREVPKDPNSLLVFLDRFIYQTRRASLSDRVMHTTDKLNVKALSEWLDLDLVRTTLANINVAALPDALRDVLNFAVAQLDALKASGLTPEQFENQRRLE